MPALPLSALHCVPIGRLPALASLLPPGVRHVVVSAGGVLEALVDAPVGDVPGVQARAIEAVGRWGRGVDADTVAAALAPLVERGIVAALRREVAC